MKFLCEVNISNNSGKATQSKCVEQGSTTSSTTSPETSPASNVANNSKNNSANKTTNNKQNNAATSPATSPATSSATSPANQLFVIPDIPEPDNPVVKQMNIKEKLILYLNLINKKNNIQVSPSIRIFQIFGAYRMTNDKYNIFLLLKDEYNKNEKKVRIHFYLEKFKNSIYDNINSTNTNFIKMIFINMIDALGNAIPKYNEPYDSASLKKTFDDWVIPYLILDGFIYKQKGINLASLTRSIQFGGTRRFRKIKIKTKRLKRRSKREKTAYKK